MPSAKYMKCPRPRVRCSQYMDFILGVCSCSFEWVCFYLSPRHLSESMMRTNRTKAPQQRTKVWNITLEACLHVFVVMKPLIASWYHNKRLFYLSPTPMSHHHKKFCFIHLLDIFVHLIDNSCLFCIFCLAVPFYTHPNTHLSTNKHSHKKNTPTQRHPSPHTHTHSHTH